MTKLVCFACVGVKILGAAEEPVPGDMFVSTMQGSYGHVSVITSVGTESITVIEQNFSPSYADNVNYTQTDTHIHALSEPMT